MIIDNLLLRKLFVNMHCALWEKLDQNECIPEWYEFIPERNEYVLNQIFQGVRIWIFFLQNSKVLKSQTKPNPKSWNFEQNSFRFLLPEKFLIFLVFLVSPNSSTYLECLFQFGIFIPFWNEFIPFRNTFIPV